MSPRLAEGTEPGLIDVSGRGSEPFRSLRLSIDLRPDRRGNGLLFTSPSPADGKSTVAANYALVSALAPRAVLLLDTDLVKPALHRRFGVPRSPGLVDVLQETVALRSALHRIPTAAGTLDLLTAGTPIRRTADVISSRAMLAVLERASLEYDVVVLDSPPVLEMPDPSALAAVPGVDTIVVAGPGQRRRPLTRTVRQLERTGANVLGLVLNRVARQPVHSYGD